MAAKRQKIEVSSAALDWTGLVFDVTPTAGRSQVLWTNGEWGEVAFETDPYIKLHSFANVLHYGQEVFEGLKAFVGKDGQVRVFNDRANFERISAGSRRMLIPEMSYELWQSMIDLALRENAAFIPPYEACQAGSTLYIRPVIFGSGPQVALHPSREFTFCVVVTPVGPYFKTGFSSIAGQVITDFDRAAPQGVGGVKCAGNYAADMLPSKQHKDQGFPIGLYLDPKEKKYVEEFNGANFIAITKCGKLVTPDSESILASITNKCLIQIAKDRGITVERRKIDLRAEASDFAEVGAVGTAAVVCPIKSLQWGDETLTFGEEPKVLRQLFQALTAIQRGEESDEHGWVRVVPMDPVA